MSDVLETVAVILQTLSARYEVLSTAIRVPRVADDGFDVTLYERQNGWLVHYDGWHEEIASEESAMQAFFFGLSEAARLKITSHGNVDHKWRLESLEGDAWSPDSETGLLLFPFWAAKRERYSQNHLLPTDWKSRLAELAGAVERDRKAREQNSSKPEQPVDDAASGISAILENALQRPPLPATDDGLIEAIQSRVHDDRGRVDVWRHHQDWEHTPLPGPVSAEQFDAAESQIGRPLHPFHRRLLAEVANGGFGPGYGLFSLPPATAESSLLEALAALRRVDTRGLWRDVLPLADWGRGLFDTEDAWACIDAASTRGWILTFVGNELFETELDIRSWFRAWLEETRLEDITFDHSRDIVGINPFTKEERVIRRRVSPTGRPYPATRR